MSNKENYKQTCRNSGIELLKIIAIFLIVISHVTNSLVSKNTYMPSSDYVIDVAKATTDINTIVLLLFRSFGSLGNLIFLVCSAWFLLQSSSWNKKKMFFMIFEIWIISIIIMIVTAIIRHGDISAELLIKSVLPNTFANNWYLTCYLLLYPLHPVLNTIASKMSKTNLLRVSLVLSILYLCFGLIKEGLFFSSTIIVWITIYFIIAYMRQHMENAINSTKNNIGLFLLGFLGYFGLAVVINFLGVHVSFINGKTSHWLRGCNPFLIVMVISLFNLMRKIDLKNKAINYVSSLSLLIYIIHENILLRNYFRPHIWLIIYRRYGYNYIILWTLVVSAMIFLFALISSLIYDKTIRLGVRKISDKLFYICKIIYLKIEPLLLKIK